MNLFRTLCVSSFLAISSHGAEPNWTSLRNKLQKALGDEWIVASDFDSFTAIRRNVKVLNTISRIDPILKDRDPWDDALTIDYTISISVRPKLTEHEYDDLVRLRDEWIITRSRGMTPGSKDAYGVHRKGEAAVALPEFYFGSSAIYITTSAPASFKLRPDFVAADRDRLLAILKTECHPYITKPRQAVAEQPATRSQSKSEGHANDR